MVDVRPKASIRPPHQKSHRMKGSRARQHSRKLAAKRGLRSSVCGKVGLATEAPTDLAGKPLNTARSTGRSPVFALAGLRP